MLLWTWVHKYLFMPLLSVSLCICPELGHILIMFIAFWGPTILYSTAVASFYVPTSNTQGVQCLHIPTLVTFWVFLGGNHLNGCEVVPPSLPSASLFLNHFDHFKMYMSVLLSTFTLLCYRHYHPASESFRLLRLNLCAH